MKREIEFPFFLVQDDWEKRFVEDVGTITVIPIEIRMELMEKCPKDLEAKWHIFATNYNYNHLPSDAEVKIYQQLNLHYQGSDYGIKCMNWINCVAKQVDFWESMGDFYLIDKIEIIGWLFSLCLAEVPELGTVYHLKS